MNSKSFFVKSYGCQMNFYDSEKITSILENKGMIEKEEIKNADVVIFNTCNIRDKAAHKVYSDIGRVTKLSQNKTIAVVGCVAQAENSEMFNKNDNIAIIQAGYADGIPLELSQYGEVKIEGKKFSIIGKISMDLIAISCNDVKINIGKDATFWGTNDINFRLETLSKKINRIPYAILTGVTKRVKRKYIDE